MKIMSHTCCDLFIYPVNHLIKIICNTGMKITDYDIEQSCLGLKEEKLMMAKK